MTELQMGLGFAGAVLMLVIMFHAWGRCWFRYFRRKSLDSQDENLDGVPALSNVMVPSFHDAAGLNIGLNPREEPVSQKGYRDIPDAANINFDDVVIIRLYQAIQPNQLRVFVNELSGLTRCAVQVFAWCSRRQQWQTALQNLDEVSDICVALQLVSRRGILQQAELAIFREAMLNFSNQYGGKLIADTPTVIHEKASAADAFCCEVDVEVGVTLLMRASCSNEQFRYMVEGHGLSLAKNGRFYREDTDGQPIFSVSQIERVVGGIRGFDQGAVRTTLLLDVPRVVDGGDAFDAMLAFSEEIASVLQGVLVDDRGHVLDETGLATIRLQIEAFQAEMTRKGVLPGSVLARRIFS